MLKWFIVGGDWKTPVSKPCGRGEGKDMKAVCKGLKEWIGVNMAHLAGREYWRFVKQEDGKVTIIDFGSWSLFARVEGEEGE